MSGVRYPEKLSAVVWDFDDTLVDSMDARVHALTRVFRDTDIVGVDPLGFLLHLPETTFELTLIGLSEKLGKPSDLFWSLQELLLDQRTRHAKDVSRHKRFTESVCRA